MPCVVRSISQSTVQYPIVKHQTRARSHPTCATFRYTTMCAFYEYLPGRACVLVYQLVKNQGGIAQVVGKDVRSAGKLSGSHGHRHIMQRKHYGDCVRLALLRGHMRRI